MRATVWCVLVLLVMMGSLTLCGCGGAGSATGTSVSGPGGSAPSDNGPVVSVVADSNAPSNSNTVSPASIGSSYQYMPVRECFYALRQAYLNQPTSITGPFGGLQVGGNVVSNWNYLASDSNAFNIVRQQSYGNATVCSYFGLQNSYALKPAYGYGIGRGGQCLFFAVLILRRSRSYTLPYSWSTLYGRRNGAASNAQPGDLIMTNGSIKHIAVVIERLSYGLDVVDSNYVGSGGYSPYSVGYYNGFYNSEIICRHPFTWSDLANKGYVRLSGAGRWY